MQNEFSQNLTEEQRTYLLGKLYEARKHTIGAADRKREKSSAENPHLNSKTPKLRMEMAKEHNLGAYDIESAVNVGRGIDRAEEVVPGIKQEVLSGKLKAKKSDLAAIRKLDTDDEVKAAVEEIRNPKPKAVKCNHFTFARMTQIKALHGVLL